MSTRMPPKLGVGSGIPQERTNMPEVRGPRQIRVGATNIKFTFHAEPGAQTRSRVDGGNWTAFGVNQLSAPADVASIGQHVIEVQALLDGKYSLITVVPYEVVPA